MSQFDPIDLKYKIAVSISGLLKNTHNAVTNVNVTTHFIAFKKTFVDGLSHLTTFSNNTNNAWKNPQNINVHFAPCHTPLTIKTVNIARPPF